MVNRDAQIYEDYENWLAAKEQVGSIDDLAGKWKMSRQRFNKIVNREKARRERQEREAQAS